jgi:NTP pyrophosphatase (non-canonical NTP hydrolase)
MKIYVLGSTSFVKEMVSAVDELKRLGHEGWIHPHYLDYVNQDNHPHFGRIEEGEHAKVKIENDYINQHYRHILESDAILVVNLEKNGIKNYIGGNVLIEMGQAYVNKKKIFLLNSIPEINYSEEIITLKPIPLNGDLSKINSIGVIVFLSEIAKRSREIQEEIGLNFDDVLNKFTQEVGELNDAVQKRRGRFCKTRLSNDDNLKDELGDVMFNLISICNRVDIDPDELPLLAKNTLDKFEERKELYKENLR